MFIFLKYLDLPFGPAILIAFALASTCRVRKGKDS